MSFRNITPVVHNALFYGQNGSLSIPIYHLALTGHAFGHGGAGLQNYKEILFGDTCRESGKLYGPEDNTSGTKFYPDIEYAVGIMGFGRDGLNEADLEIMADSVVGSPFAAQIVNGNGTYDPDYSISYYFHPINGDMIWGKFNRIAIFRTSSGSVTGSVIVQLGPGNGPGSGEG